MAKRRVTASPEKENKAVVRQYFKYIMSGKPKEAIVLFAPGARHHNPYLPPGMEAVLSSMAEAQRGDTTLPSDGVFKIADAIAEGNSVVVYTTLVSASDKSKGMRQVHIFKLKGGKIAEYWDVTQAAPEGAPNAPNMW